MKKAIDYIILAVSLAGNVFGILSLLTIIGVANIMPFYNNFEHILIGYVIVVISMAIGIMSFNLFAGRRQNPAKNILSIAVTTYSTILTIPLFLTFVLCLIPIYNDLVSIFKPEWAQYLIFIGGIILGIIFLAVPIIMCIATVKPKKIK